MSSLYCMLYVLAIVLMNFDINADWTVMVQSDGWTRLLVLMDIACDVLLTLLFGHETTWLPSSGL